LEIENVPDVMIEKFDEVVEVVEVVVEVVEVVVVSLVVLVVVLGYVALMIYHQIMVVVEVLLFLMVEQRVQVEQ
jgi:purine-cytosine permease-like protein